MKKIWQIYGVVLFCFSMIIPVAAILSGTDIPLYSPYITEDESDNLVHTYSKGFALDRDQMIWETYVVEQTLQTNISSTLRMMNLSDGKTQILATSPSPEHLYTFDTPFGIADGWVAWRENSNIFVYDSTSREAYALTTDGAGVDLGIQRENRDPFLSADRVVWAKKKLYPSKDYDIVLYNLTSRTLREIPTSPSKKTTPAMEGSRIVWVDQRDEPGKGDIYLLDLEQNEERPICTARDLQQYPRVSGEYVVWEDYRDGPPEIYLYNLVTGNETRISDGDGFTYASVPYLSGNYVAWTEYSVFDRTHDKYRKIIVYNVVTGEKEIFLKDSPVLVLLDLNDNRILYADPDNKSLKEGYVHLFIIDVPETNRSIVSPSPSPELQNPAVHPEYPLAPATPQPASAGFFPAAIVCTVIILWIRNRVINK